MFISLLTKLKPQIFCGFKNWIKPFPYLGSTTESITWMIPLPAFKSVATTVAVPPFSSVNITFPFFNEAVTVPPLTVFNAKDPSAAVIAFTTVAASNVPEITW